jgi:hypothetical protein
MPWTSIHGRVTRAQSTINEDTMKRFLLSLFALTFLMFGYNQTAWADNAPAYNPCDHLADQYNKLSSAEYQGLVGSCQKPASVQDKVQHNHEHDS